MHRQQGLFLSVYVEDIKMTGKEHNLEPMWNRLMKHDMLEKPTIFWIKCTGDALNVNVSQTKRLSTSAILFRMSHLRRYNRELTWLGEFALASYPLVFIMWKHMRRNAGKDVGSEQRRTTSDQTKPPHLAVDDHQFKEEELDSVGR